MSDHHANTKVDTLQICQYLLVSIEVIADHERIINLSEVSEGKTSHTELTWLPELCDCEYLTLDDAIVN